MAEPANFFDMFDKPDAGNYFDQFDVDPAAIRSRAQASGLDVSKLTDAEIKARFNVAPRGNIIDQQADLAKGFGAGLRSGAEQIVSLPGEAQDLCGRLIVRALKGGNGGGMAENRRTWTPAMGNGA